MDKRMNFWLGLSDMKHEGNWRLASNGLKPSYLNWHKKEPSNDTSDKNCARLRTGPNSSQSQKDTWGDAKCTAEKFDWNNVTISFHALCEYDSLTTSSTEDTTTKGASTKSKHSHQLKIEHIII